MEAIICIVGFLGAGKTTLLKHLTKKYTEIGWQPFVVLNDYENAYIDAQQLTQEQNPTWIKALHGSCICCSGIQELRETVNRIPKREQGITLIEANGTSDACALIEFLGVGLEPHFLPPVQISVVDVSNWQQRGEHNELEANQIQVSSLIVLTHIDAVSELELQKATESIQKINPKAAITNMSNLDLLLLPKLKATENHVEKIDHLKSHWSSCSIDLPVLASTEIIQQLCSLLPQSILRVKGCCQLTEQENYVYFERKPNGTCLIRPFNGIPTTGSKLLTIGPGSNPNVLQSILDRLY
ncbi:GTP-binding protein [Ochrovirga pacifica]|uniref:GTP-binding protein n=1 Tax=Ochrovirga pacifica TaxID=1042376 RepID=UPI000255A2AF|nr:GTP-binding protein [Ochrovirga pacifica]